MTGNPNAVPYAKAIARLLQGVVYNDEPYWNDITLHQMPITEYLEKIAVELVVDKPEGYAYIKQIPLDEDGSTVGLVRRTPMTYEAGLICIFLRERLDDFDIKDTPHLHCMVTHKELKEDIELFFKEKPNVKKFLRDIDKHIGKVVDYGFLKIRRKGESDDDTQYEIRRIIKAKVSSDHIESFRKKMEEHA